MSGKLPCRELQAKQIHNFLKKSIQAGGSGSGMCASPHAASHPHDRLLFFGVATKYGRRAEGDAVQISSPESKLRVLVSFKLRTSSVAQILDDLSASQELFSVIQV